MSVYTTQLRFICESLIGLEESAGQNSVEDICKQAAPIIFYRFPITEIPDIPAFEELFLRYYYRREICMETYGAWRLELMNRLDELAPMYNQLYASAKLQIDPFNDIDYTVNHTGSSEGNTTDKKDTTTSGTSDTVNSESTVYSEDKTVNSESTSKSEGTSSKTANGTDDFTDTTDKDTTEQENKTGTNDYTDTTDMSNVKSGSETVNDNLTKTGTVSDKTGNITKSKDGADTDTNTDNSNNWSLYSDTPQGGLTGVKNETYLTNATHNYGDGGVTKKVTDYNTTETEKYNNVAETQNANELDVKTTTFNDVKSKDSGTVKHDGDTTEKSNIEGTEDITFTHSDKNSYNENANTIDNTTEEEKTVSDTDGNSKTDGTSNTTTTGSKNENASGTSQSSDEYTNVYKGKQSQESYSKRLLEYRETFLNLDKMLLDDLDCLFMQIF